MLTPEMRKIFAYNISTIQGKMADRIVEIMSDVEQCVLFENNESIDVELVSKVLKKLFDNYIDEMDNMITEYDHQDTPVKLLTDISHAIERLNKGYINFIKDTTEEKLKIHVMEYLTPKEDPEEPVIEPVEEQVEQIGEVTPEVKHTLGQSLAE